MKLALTDPGLRSVLSTPDRWPVDISDTSCPGLVARIRDTGSLSWQFNRQWRGVRYRVNAGDYPAVPLREARELIRLAWTKLRHEGIDPIKTLRAGSRDAETLSRWIDRYEIVVIKPKQAKGRRLGFAGERQEIERYFAGALRKSIDQLNRSDIQDPVDELVGDGYQASARRAFAVLHPILKHIDRKSDDGLPFSLTRLHRPESPAPRDRSLNDDELTAVLSALDQLEPPFPDIYRGLLLTGVRVGELIGMRTSEIFGERWTVPAIRMKSRQAHLVPLVGSMKAIIDRNRNRGIEHVFTDRRGKPIGVTEYSEIHAQLKELSGVDDWIRHDLRRTLTDGMVALGISPGVADLILAHKDALKHTGMTAVGRTHYLSADTLRYEAEKREALELWELHLDSLAQRSELPRAAEA